MTKRWLDYKASPISWDVSGVSMSIGGGSSLIKDSMRTQDSAASLQHPRSQ